MAQSKKIHKQHKKLGNAIAYLVLIIISIYRASVLILQSSVAWLIICCLRNFL